MLGLAGVGEDPGMDARMQRLDAALEGFGESGEVLDLGDRDSGVGDLARRRSGGHQSDARGMQTGRKFDQSGLVVDTDQCAAHRFTFTHRII